MPALHREHEFLSVLTNLLFQQQIFRLCMIYEIWKYKLARWHLNSAYYRCIAINESAKSIKAVADFRLGDVD